MDQQSKHTPGPWSTDGRVLRNAAGNSIASSGNNRVVTGDELDASMRLAAAAPDLLSALKVALPILKGHQESPDRAARYENAAAAIAKAEGR